MQDKIARILEKKWALVEFTYYEEKINFERDSSIMWTTALLKTENDQPSLLYAFEVELLKLSDTIPIKDFLSEQLERMHIKLKQCANLCDDELEEEEEEQSFME